MTNFIIFIIILIILIWILPIKQTNNIANEALLGFYIGDNSFMEEAGLKNLIIYLDKKTGHIYLEKNSGEILLNSSFNWQLNNSLTSNWNKNLNTKRIFNISFKGINSDSFPSNQILEFYPLVGKILLRKKNTVHAVLYKDNCASEIKNIIESK